MVKNEIHARLPAEMMQQVREFTKTRNLPNLSHGVRWLMDVALKEINDEFELEKKNTSIVQLIEQECKVFFARCRDEYDPEDGQLYWFWFESEAKSSWQFYTDSHDNWCPTKRFKTQEDAIKDCLRKMLSRQTNETTETATLVSFTETTKPENIIDW